MRYRKVVYFMLTHYRTKLSDYVASRKLIGMAFISAATEAEEECDKFSESTHTASEHDRAQNEFKRKIRAASAAHAAAVEALGPPPEIPN